MLNRTFYLLIGMMVIVFSTFIGCSKNETSENQDQSTVETSDDAGFVEEEAKGDSGKAEGSNEAASDTDASEGNCGSGLL